MIKKFVFALVLTASVGVYAIPFEPKFSDYTFPGTQFTVDAAANDFFRTNYGIEIDNAYLYKDSRDTFDGVGISVGEVSEIGTTQTGRISFVDTTDFVSIQYFTIHGTNYSAYDTVGTLLKSISFTGGLNSTYDFVNIGRIAYLEWTSDGGYGQVSGLSYDFDGNTDGKNDDLDPQIPTVPDSGSTVVLAMLGLGLIAAAKRRSR